MAKHSCNGPVRLVCVHLMEGQGKDWWGIPGDDDGDFYDWMCEDCLALFNFLNLSCPDEDEVEGLCVKCIRKMQKQRHGRIHYPIMRSSDGWQYGWKYEE